MLTPHLDPGSALALHSATLDVRIRSAADLLTWMFLPIVIYSSLPSSIAFESSL